MPIPSILKIPESALQSLYTLWLFTESDFATFVLPNTLFGTLGALSGRLTINSASIHPDRHQILAHLPTIIAFNWLNLLVFDIANQRLPSAVTEDSLNKPWRPLPTNRITPAAAQTLLLVTIPTVLLAGHAIGAGPERSLLMALTWMYNDLGGGERSYWARNIIIATGYALYNAGSLKLAVGQGTSISSTGLSWIALISAVILTTMHVQDLKDQLGDRRRGRRTAPIVLGDATARWTIVAALELWPIVCPIFWRVGMGGFLLSAGLAMLIAIQNLGQRNAKADSLSWKLWAGWMVVLYSLPLFQRLR